MTITIELDGIKVEAETEKEARKELRKLLKAKEKADAERNARYEIAKQQAMCDAYRILARKAEMTKEEFDAGETLPWRLYTPEDDYAKHLFMPITPDKWSYDWPLVNEHEINARGGKGRLGHYGHEVVGALCSGGGFCWAVFLRDRRDPNAPITCLTVAVEGDCLTTVNVPGVRLADFRKKGF